MARAGRGWLRLLGRVVIAFVVVLAVAYVGLVFATNRMLAATVTVPAAVSPVRIPDASDTAALERGRYLVDHAFNCKICHAPDFGGHAEVNDALIGSLWAPNLTSGAGSAVRDFTATDWARAIRHGVTPTGRRLILMPSEEFFGFNDDDLGAVVAYIRSMPPVDRADEGIKVGPLGRALLAAGEVTFAFDKIDHAATRSAASPAATAAWGQVLLGTCAGCHGEGLSGGPIPGGDPSWPPSRNLTPHATGLGAWTQQDFFVALRQGRRPDGTAINPPMPWQAYAGLTDTDLEAMWLYLRTVPAKESGGR